MGRWKLYDPLTIADETYNITYIVLREINERAAIGEQDGFLSIKRFDAF